MAYSTWPSALPQAPYYRYEGQQVNGLLDTETFLATQRTRTYPEESASFTFVQLTAAQFQTFRAWWDVTLNQCAPFTAPWLEAISTLPYFCRFDPESPWSATINGFGIDLTINIELVAGVPKTDEGDIDYWLPVGPPEISFTANVVSGVVPFGVAFTVDTSAGGTPTSYLWDFGDGATSSQKNPTHSYATAGVYTVSLTATNTKGSDTATRVNYIVALAELLPPDIEFSGSPHLGPAPLTVYFSSANLGGPADSYLWNFGDGSNSSVAHPVHVYTDGGTYTVSLTATNTKGSDTVTRTGYIVAGVTASAGLGLVMPVIIARQREAQKIGMVVTMPTIVARQREAQKMGMVVTLPPYSINTSVKSA